MAINTNPGRRELVAFGLALPVFFSFLGLVIFERTGLSLAALVVWVGGLLVVASYLVVPVIRRPVFVGWAYAAYPISWVVTHVLLVAVFCLVITPIALLVRLFGRDPLSKEYDSSVDSYWVPREKPVDVKRYFQQF